jgi:hypothetical protein
MTEKLSITQKPLFLSLLAIILVLLPSCGLGEAVEGIFKFGFWAGALLVIIVLAILGFIIYKIFKK